VFVHSPPQISRMVWPTHGMMQIEGEVLTSGTQRKYNVKLVLSLESTFNARGWMWFEETYNKLKFIACLSSGNWNTNGSLSFNVHCSPQGTLPNSRLNPTNWTSTFEIEGKFEHPKSSSLAVFIAKIMKKERDISIHKDELPLTPLDNLTSMECHDIRVASIWHSLFSNGRHDLQKETSKLVMDRIVFDVF